jgi:hypothetical protein
MLQHADVSELEGPIDSDAVFAQKPAQQTEIGRTSLLHNLPYCELKRQIELLGNKRDCARHGSYGKPVEGLIVQEHTARTASQDAGGETKECGFAYAVRADQRGATTLLQIEARRLNYIAVTVAEADIRETQQWVHSA